MSLQFGKTKCAETEQTELNKQMRKLIGDINNT